MHVTMESLLNDKSLISIIKDLIRRSARSYPQKELEMKKGSVTVPGNPQTTNEAETVTQDVQTNEVSKNAEVAAV